MSVFDKVRESIDKGETLQLGETETMSGPMAEVRLRIEQETRNYGNRDREESPIGDDDRMVSNVVGDSGFLSAIRLRNKANYSSN